MYSRTTEKRRLSDITVSPEQIHSALVNSACLESPKMGTNCERKVRREIANSNERRRMKSINAGFESLKMIIPHQDGEKLSKAAILQQTANYVSTLEDEKSCLLSQNNQLRTLLNQFTGDNLYKDSPPPKRKKRDTESSDEGIGLCITSEYDEEMMVEEIKKQVVELKMQLERERALRSILEERTRMMHGEVLYPQHVRIFADTVQKHMDSLKNDKQIIRESKVTKLAEEAPPATIGTEDRQPLQPSPTEKQTAMGAHSMSQRNLHTIVQAIRHLEGDCVMPHDAESQRRHDTSEETAASADSQYEPRLVRENSADSGRETCSDLDEMKCLPKRVSPSPHDATTAVHTVPDLATNLSQLSPVALNSPERTILDYQTSPSPQKTPFLNAQDIVKDKFPVSIHLLHQPVISQYYSPGITHKC